MNLRSLLSISAGLSLAAMAGGSVLIPHVIEGGAQGMVTAVQNMCDDMLPVDLSSPGLLPDPRVALNAVDANAIMSCKRETEVSALVLVG